MLFLYFLEQKDMQLGVFNFEKILAMICSYSLAFVKFQAPVVIKLFLREFKESKKRV